eukprot:CAMPEP_0197858926 /NCGR_PEP_ID=MMETSP1438-20131217/33098_1 /TAXON_ID=1461541 /ORGANISM="Pterosperma sp., Strain CCMP1384" /LENGTH=277 /DNA_ID=CAMNT_0043475235 /DNA_START=253 /DNA_END=1083 /DNA_ORIENTATION=-
MVFYQSMLLQGTAHCTGVRTTSQIARTGARNGQLQPARLPLRVHSSPTRLGIVTRRLPRCASTLHRSRSRVSIQASTEGGYVEPPSSSEILKPYERLRMNEDPDEAFYEQPVLTPYTDHTFEERVQELYSSHLQPHHHVLDFGASWNSHLPPGYKAAHMTGLGMNQQELDANLALDNRDIVNVNTDTWRSLPYDSNSFDCILCCCCIQYLRHPEAVLAELHRVLRPGGCILVSYSRPSMAQEKTVRAWLEGRRGPSERVFLMKSCLSAAGFTRVDVS